MFAVCEQNLKSAFPASFDVPEFAHKSQSRGRILKNFYKLQLCFRDIGEISSEKMDAWFAVRSQDLQDVLSFCSERPDSSVHFVLQIVCQQELPHMSMRIQHRIRPLHCEVPVTSPAGYPGPCPLYYGVEFRDGTLWTEPDEDHVIMKLLGHTGSPFPLTFFLVHRSHLYLKHRRLLWCI